MAAARRAPPRVVVTGLGVVSSIGLGREGFSQGLREGRSGISPITRFDTTGFDHSQGGEIRAFDPAIGVRHLEARQWGRCSLFAAAAARMAIDDATRAAELDLGDAGVAVGTTDGESGLIDELTERWVEHGLADLPADAMCKVPANRLALAVSEEARASGDSVTIPTACAAGNYAIGYAFDLIRSGARQTMLCGGADTLNRKTFAGFYRLGAVAPERCQPFDRGRQGILTGEGAAMLVLETLDAARARGAHAYAEVLGYGLSCDAKHMVAPDPPRIEECMRAAHRNAGIGPRDVDYICAHGTGTKVNDAVESSAIRAVFGDAIPPVSSIKSMIGHTMGAASAIAAVACALAIDERFLPPTINFEEADPECVPDCVPNHARPQRVRVAQNNAFAFGGNNAIVIFAEPLREQLVAPA